MTNNWLSNSTNTIYTHKDNHNVKVEIILNKTDPQYGKYWVFHSHPALGGRSVPQEMERAKNMASARKKADMHMHHWENSFAWSRDPDYGKKGLVGK